MKVINRLGLLLAKVILVVALIVLVLYILDVVIHWSHFITVYWSMSTKG